MNFHPGIFLSTETSKQLCSGDTTSCPLTGYDTSSHCECLKNTEWLTEGSPVTKVWWCTDNWRERKETTVDLQDSVGQGRKWERRDSRHKGKRWKGGTAEDVQKRHLAPRLSCVKCVSISICQSTNLVYAQPKECWVKWLDVWFCLKTLVIIIVAVYILTWCSSSMCTPLAYWHIQIGCQDKI